MMFDEKVKRYKKSAKQFSMFLILNLNHDFFQSYAASYVVDIQDVDSQDIDGSDLDGPMLMDLDH